MQLEHGSWKTWTVRVSFDRNGCKDVGAQLFQKDVGSNGLRAEGDRRIWEASRLNMEGLCKSVQGLASRMLSIEM